MLHRQILDAIDAYIDNELDTITYEQVRRHLQECDECRKEYDSALRLRHMLENDSIPDPGEEYWNEVTSLIMAKTVDTTPEKTTVINIEQQKLGNKRAFYRSLISVAASLIFFFTSLILGSSQNKPIIVNNSSSEYSLQTSIISEAEKTDNNVILTKDEQRNILKGIILLGSPGHFEQYGILSDLSLGW